MCDLLGKGFEIEWAVKEKTFCAHGIPLTFTHWYGSFLGNPGASTYSNDADCTWYIDVDPKAVRVPGSTKGGHKVEKLDIWLDTIDVHEGITYVHPFPDFVTVYKGLNRTSAPCTTSCVQAVGVRKWEQCPIFLSQNPHQKNCMLTRQSGKYIYCDPTNKYEYHISCWDNPSHWTVACAHTRERPRSQSFRTTDHPALAALSNPTCCCFQIQGSQARIDFSSSRHHVGKGFTIRWEAEISSPQHSYTKGMGTVMGKAGYVANITVHAVWKSIASGDKYIDRTTGGAKVSLQLVYQNRSVEQGIYAEVTWPTMQC